jgi:tRNA A37 methylthiotransferase MiaB
MIPIGNQDAELSNKELETYCSELRGTYSLNRKILFVQIPQFLLSSFSVDVAKRKGYYAFPPTGLQCLCEALRHRNIECRILDLSIEVLKRSVDDPGFQIDTWVSILDKALEDFDPGIVGVSCMFDSGIAPLIEILTDLKRRDRSIVIAGGVIPTYEWKQLLDRHLAHFVIQGEGENKLNFLFDNLLEEKKQTVATPGIYFQWEKSLYESHGKPDVVIPGGDLVDSYRLIHIEDYSRYGSLNPYSRMASNSAFAAIQLNRGCRAKCTFCAVRDFMGRGVRSRTVDDVITEMEYLITRHGIKHFEWLDDDLLIHKSQLQKILQAVVDRNWKITWAANNGLLAISLDDDLLRLMRDSGCIGFKIGIETGNAEVLKSVRKPGTLDTFRRASKLLGRYPEIFVGGNYIVGFPGETFGQMMDTFRFQLEMKLDWSAFTMCQVIRGASAFNDFADYFTDQMAADGRKTQNFIPTRENTENKVDSTQSVRKGPRIFEISPEEIPPEDQVKEIWFTFNLVGNYLLNKNLAPGGNPEKFIRWVEMAQIAYPNNAYMSLFLGLAHQLLGNKVIADSYRLRADGQLTDAYWQARLQEFGLLNTSKDFPVTCYETENVLEKLRAQAQGWLKG